MPLNIPDLARIAFREGDIEKRVPTADPDSEYAHTNTLEFARMCVDAHYKRTAFRSLGEEALTVLRDAFPK